jgi:multiple sugar transport system substrate-binding protein
MTTIRPLACAVAAAALLLVVAGSASAQKKTIRLWQTETEPQTLAILNQMAAEYEKANPNVSVKIEGLAWGDLEKKLTAALAAGAPPDAAHGQPITCVSFAAKGLLRPVDDLVAAIGEQDLLDAFRNLCRWEGKHYGVGHSPASSIFVYRKDLLAQKGLKVPKTWDDLIKTAEALRETKDGQVVRYGLTMTGQPLFVNIAVGELLKTNGGRLFDAEGRPTLTDKRLIELLDFYKKLNTVLPPGWTGHGYLDTFANLANGKAAMLYQAYGRGAGYIEKYAPPELADPNHFAVADKLVGPSGKSPAAQLDCEPWMVFKDAPGGNEAVDFLKFFFKDENYVPYLHSVPIHLLPIKKSTYRNPKYADNAMIRKWRPWVDMQEKYFKNDLIKPVLVTDWDDMKKPYLLEVMGSGILVDMVLDSVKGVPSTEAAAKAQKRVEELLARSGYLKK